MVTYLAVQGDIKVTNMLRQKKLKKIKSSIKNLIFLGDTCGIVQPIFGHSSNHAHMETHEAFNSRQQTKKLLKNILICLLC
jgi:hypothetical protein